MPTAPVATAATRGSASTATYYSWFAGVLVPYHGHTTVDNPR